MTFSPSNFGWSRRTDKLITKTHFFRSACTIMAGAETRKPGSRGTICHKKTMRTQNAEHAYRTATKHFPFPRPSTQQPNGFELTCGAVSMRARFAHDTELLLIENCTTNPLTASTTERVHAATAG
jgi:hypothetical protein